MNLYQILSLRHSRDVYKRGRFKGDAPADRDRRAKTHFRIVKHDEFMGVIFHRTQIITAYPDGRVRLRANGYQNSPTTRDAFSHMGFVFQSKYNNGYKNTLVRGYLSGCGVNDWHVFYDDMMLDSLGHLIGEAKPQYKYVADRAARKEFDADAAEFRSLIPLLLATSHSRVSAARDRLGSFIARTEASYCRSRTRAILELGNAEQYADLVDAWSRYAYDEGNNALCHKRLWSALRASCVRDMRNIVEV